MVQLRECDRADEEHVLNEARESARAAIGQGWVDEILVRDVGNQRAVRLAIEIGRNSGRLVRLLAVDQRTLPSARRDERWIAEDREGEASWLLVRCERPVWQRVVKRTLDVVGAAAVLCVLSPLLLVLCMVVRATSEGPVFYRWRVLARNGRPFTGYKFRTMVADADARKVELMAHNEMVGPVFKMDRDPRITPVGRCLRKFSLDELPQLWSVLKGDMSLVGPRPPSREEHSNFELWQMRKLSVTPGITCIWQARGRNRINNFADWARLDLEYIDNWSLWLDLQLLLQTAAAVAKGTGK